MQSFNEKDNSEKSSFEYKKDIYQAIHKTKIGAVKKRKKHLLKYKTEKSMVILALLISGQLDHTSMGG